MSRKILILVLILTATAPALWAQAPGNRDDAPRSSLLPDAAVVRAQTLRAESFADEALRDDLGLQVTLLTLENGAHELQSTFSPRTNSTEEIAIHPDYALGTYRVTTAPVDWDALERDGIKKPTVPDGKPTDGLEKIFGGTFCRKVHLLSRDNTGAAGVIRSQTITMLDWRWYSDSGFNCIQVLDRAHGCLPAFGMTKAGCFQVTTDDGSNHATQTTNGHYTGTPPGSIALQIFNTTRIRANTWRGTVEASNLVLPITEPSTVSFIVVDNLYTCAQPH